MKKAMILLLSVLVALSVFVSCNPEQKAPDGQTRMVQFNDGRSVSRALSRAPEGLKTEDLYWSYTAEKLDDSGFTTGQTAVKTAVGTKGLTASVGPFSQGEWKFTLYGFIDGSRSKLAWTGSTNVRLTVRDGVSAPASVSVDVHRLRTPGVKGIIRVPADLKVHDNAGNNVGTAYSLVVKVYKGEELLTFAGHTGTDYEVESGLYKVVVSAESNPGQEDDIVYASNEITVNVYDNLVTTVGGTLNETTLNTKFATNENGETVATSPEKKIEYTGETGNETFEIKVESTPVEEHSAVEKPTTVSFPKDAFKPGATNASISVIPSNIESANTNKEFTVEANEAVVGAIDIDVVVDGEKTSTFEGGRAATVTTYIQPGLPADGVAVRYNGPESNVVVNVVSYDPVDGKLVFTTNHFSEYYVVVKDIEAVNNTSHRSYATLKAALENPEIKSGDEIIMLGDISNTDYSASNTWIFNIPGGVILNGNGHSIIGNCTVKLNPDGGTVRNVEFKYIHNDKDVGNGGSWKFPTPKTGDLTALYASDLKGKAVIENCIFNTFDWEGIQMTPVAGAEIHITGNTFRYDAANGLGMEYPLRNIHVQSKKNVDFSIVATGNVLLDNDKLYQTGFEVYYPKDMNKCVLSGNYIDDPVGVCILKGTGTDVAGAVLPFGEGPDGEPAFHTACYTYDSWGNAFFCSSLEQAIEKAGSSYDIVLLEDIVVNGELGFPVNRINTNGHALTSVWDGTSADTAWYSDQASTFTLSSASQLAGLSKLVLEGKSFAGKTVNLGIDVDLADHEWIPIGSTSRAKTAEPIENRNFFLGNFNGKNHKIHNLKVTRNGTDPEVDDDNVIGLFGMVGGSGSIKNLEIASGSVNNAMDGAAGIIGGIAVNTGDTYTVDHVINRAGVNSEFTVGVKDAGSSAAGIVARAYSFQGMLTGGTRTNGIINITNCDNYGDIVGRNGKSGGIVGISASWIDRLTVSNCKNFGNITDTYAAGGILGYANVNREVNLVQIDSCENKGDVTVEGDYTASGADRWIGDMVGYISKANSTNAAGDSNLVLTGNAAKTANLTIAVKTEGGLKRALGENADVIKLDGDITVDTALQIPDGVIDLNGHSLNRR